MKNIIIKSLAAITLMGSFASCKDYLDQTTPSSTDDKNIFSMYDLAKGAITNIYTYFGEQNYRARQVWYGYNTDIEFYLNSEKNGDGKADLAVYDIFPNNNQLNNVDGKEPWSNMYSGIEKANLAIKGLRENADLTDPRMAQLLGEALTLRALTYVDLINMWGDVPARFEPTTSDNQYKARQDRDDIYIQIIADLQEAEKLCAWPLEMDITNTVERINKAFVKGLLARTCMQAAGSALRADGTIRTSDRAELSKATLYPIALQACKDVMDQESKGIVGLTSNFEKFWQDFCGDVIKAGGESLFEVGYANEPTARGRIVYTFGGRHETADVMVNYRQSGGSVGPTANFFFDYDIKDTRRDVTIMPYQWNNGKQEATTIKKFYFGKYRYEWMNRLISSTDDGINKLYMRYADIILMRAELENELNGPAAAAPYLKKIRQRAFKSGDWAEKVDNYVASVSGSKEAMFNAIVDERAFEFAGELLRKADLIRWGKLKSKMDEAKQKMYALRGLSSYTDANGKVYDYSDLSGHLYVKPKAYNGIVRNISIENGALDFYGLNHGEMDIDPAGYTEITNTEGNPTTWIGESKLEDTLIESLYFKDPDKYMYWPIFQYNLNDNYMLENYSWYNK